MTPAEIRDEALNVVRLYYAAVDSESGDKEADAAADMAMFIEFIAQHFDTNDNDQEV